MCSINLLTYLLTEALYSKRRGKLRHGCLPLHDTEPCPHLSESDVVMFSHYLPPRSLRSSNTNLLTRPAGITSSFSSRAFSVSAPSTWNYLPAHIRSIDTLSTFKTPPKISSLPVCLYRLVILCQRLRFVLTIFGAI